MKPWKLAMVGLVVAWSACTCQPLVDAPDGGGTGGGGATGGGTATGGGSASGGGNATGGGGGAAEVDAGSFTDFVKAIIATDTNETALPRLASEFQNLPDDHTGTFPGYFP